MKDYYRMKIALEGKIYQDDIGQLTEILNDINDDLFSYELTEHIIRSSSVHASKQNYNLRIYTVKEITEVDTVLALLKTYLERMRVVLLRDDLALWVTYRGLQGSTELSKESIKIIYEMKVVMATDYIYFRHE